MPPDTRTRRGPAAAGHSKGSATKRNYEQCSADKLYEAAAWARLYRHDEDEARELEHLAALYAEADRICDELRMLKTREAA